MELALSEWGVDHIRIRKEWTFQQLDLLIRKFGERKEAEAEAMANAGKKKSKRVPLRSMLASMGGKLQKVVRGPATKEE